MICHTTSYFHTSENQPPFPNNHLDFLIQIELGKELEIDAKKILEHYHTGLASEKTIKLSRLGLKHLPPYILLQCLNAKEIDISGNNIHWLPEEIKNLDLHVLNISGNVRLQQNLHKFPWLLKMTKLKLIANDMGFNFIPEGFAGRFESNQIPAENGWMDALTQDSRESF